MTMNLERKKEIFNVGGKAYISMSWSPMKAAKNLPKIGKAFAVPISFLIAGGENIQSAIPTAMMMLFEQLEEQDITELFSLILADIWCKSTDKALDIDADLENIDELLQLTANVLKQHYGALINGKGFTNLFQVMVPLHQMAV
jgi:hypothetical protein